MLRQRDRSHVFLFRIIAVFGFAFLVAVLMLSILLYRQSTARLRLEIQQANVESALRARNAIDQIVETIRREMVNIALSPDLSVFLRTDWDGDLFTLSERLQRLSRLALRLSVTNAAIDSVRVYLPSHGYVVTADQSHSIWGFPDTEPYFLARSEDLPASAVPAVIHTLRESALTPGRMYLTFVAYAPLQGRDARASIVLDVRTTFIESVLAESMVAPQSGLIVRDSGAVLSSFPSDADSLLAASGQHGRTRGDGLLSSVDSQSTAWRVTAFVSAADLRAYLAPHARFVWVLSIIVLVVGGATVVVISLRIYRPIDSLYESVNGLLPARMVRGRHDRNEIETIRWALTVLGDRSAEAQQKLAAHYPLIRNSYLHNVLRGVAVPAGPTQDNTGESVRLRVDLQRDLFLTMVRIREFGADSASVPHPRTPFDLEIAKHRLTGDLISDMVDAEVVDLAGPDLVMIANASASGRVVAAVECHEPPVCWALLDGAVSTLASQLPDLFTRLEAAATRMYLVPDRGAVPLDELEDRIRGGATVPSSSADRVVAAVVGGSMAEVNDSVTELFATIRTAAPPRGELTLIIGSVASQLERAVQNAIDGQASCRASFVAVRQQLQRDASIGSIETTLRGLCEELQREISSHRRARRARMMEAVFDYLGEHFADYISLEHVSTRVGVSVEHLSRTFKEYAGVNYKEYMDRLRIRKVCELLSDPDIAILDASERAGFTNTSTFYRVFRKVTGTTPVLFRRSAAIDPATYRASTSAVTDCQIAPRKSASRCEEAPAVTAAKSSGTKSPRE